jgi:hypothetical protein
VTIWGRGVTSRTDAGRGTVARPGVILPAALVVLVAAVLLLTVGPGRAAQAVGPALDHAVEVAAGSPTPSI